MEKSNSFLKFENTVIHRRVVSQNSTKENMMHAPCTVII